MEQEKHNNKFNVDEWNKMEQEFANFSKNPKIKLFDANTLWDNLKFEVGYFFKNIVTSIRSIKQGLKNLWEWKGIIWRNRWYDYSFFMSLQKKQLTYMRDNWDNAHYVHSEREKETLDKLIRILDEIEQYDDVDQEMVNKKYQEFGDLLYKTTKKTSVYIDENGTTHQQTTNVPNILRLWD